MTRWRSSVARAASWSWGRSAERRSSTAWALASRIGFAGPIGVVGASGTGVQEETSLIHRLGSGVSLTIATGGHDLRADVGGPTTFRAVEALAADVDRRFEAPDYPSGEALTDAFIEHAVKAASSRLKG